MINYQLSMTSKVILNIYDLLGREVTTLVDQKLPAGKHQAVWNATGMPGGIYYYKIQAGEYQEVKKMILMK
jgi:hypothetical protein